MTPYLTTGGRGLNMRLILLSLIASLLLASCAPQISPVEERRGPVAGTGQLSLYLDGPDFAPLDLAVVVSAIEVEAVDGKSFSLIDAPLTLKSKEEVGKRTLIGQRELHRGRYQKIRVKVTSAYIIREEERADLAIPEAPFEYLFGFEIFPREETPIYMAWNVGASVRGRFQLDLAMRISTKARAAAPNLLFVTSEQGNRVSVIDRISWREVASIPVGFGPRGIVAEKGTLAREQKTKGSEDQAHPSLKDGG